MRQDDLGSCTAEERHQPSALIADRLLRPAPDDLVHAHDPVVEQPAQQRTEPSVAYWMRSTITERAARSIGSHIWICRSIWTMAGPSV